MHFVKATGYDNPRGHDIWLACIITPIIAAGFVFTRFYSKLFILRNVDLSDWISLATLGISIPFSVTLAQATYYGMGLHQSAFKENPELNKGYYFWIMVSSVFYVIALAGYKSALLLLYIRIFNVYTAFRYACYFWLAFTNAYLFSNLITELGGCHPIRKFWDESVEGHCIVYVACDIAYGACNLISDLAIAILPLPMVWRLKVSNKRDKFGLSIVLGTGAVAFVVAMVRYVYATTDLTSSDRTWIAGKTFFWSVLEVYTGIICGCTPALKPFLKYLGEQRREWTSRRSRSDGHNSRPSISRTYLTTLATKDSLHSIRKTSSPYSNQQAFADEFESKSSPKLPLFVEDTAGRRNTAPETFALTAKRAQAERPDSDYLFEGYQLKKDRSPV